MSEPVVHTIRLDKNARGGSGEWVCSCGLPMDEHSEVDPALSDPPRAPDLGGPTTRILDLCCALVKEGHSVGDVTAALTWASLTLGVADFAEKLFKPKPAR